MTAADIAAERPAIRLQEGDMRRATWQLRAFRLGVRAIFLLLFRVRITGWENLPERNAIMCINHLGWTEGFMTLLFLPVEPRIYGLGERQVAYIAPWRTKIINWLAIFIPLDRDSPRQALATSSSSELRGATYISPSALRSYCGAGNARRWRWRSR